MAFTTEREYGGRVVHSDFLLFGIVSYTHSNMVVAGAAKEGKSGNKNNTGSRTTYHHILKGNSNRVIKIPWSILRALSPRACLPALRLSISVLITC